MATALRTLKTSPTHEEADVSSADEHAGVLNQEEFEELARMADRVNEAVRLEFLEGRVVEKPMPDGDHSTIIEWLSRLCMQARDRVEKPRAYAGAGSPCTFWSTVTPAR
jgi:Uma2 family endonuclease